MPFSLPSSFPALLKLPMFSASNISKTPLDSDCPTRNACCLQNSTECQVSFCCSWKQFSLEVLRWWNSLLCRVSSRTRHNYWCAPQGKQGVTILETEPRNITRHRSVWNCEVPGRTETGNKTKEMNFSFMNLNAISFFSAWVAGGIVYFVQVREATILAAFPQRARESISSPFSTRRRNSSTKNFLTLTI